MPDLTENYGLTKDLSTEDYDVGRVNANTDKIDAQMKKNEIAAKKFARFVVGTSFNSQGWAAHNCNYLCDGVDDQVEINAAIAALPATGGEIVILDGTYNISAEIFINKNNVSIRGNGNSTTIKRMFSGGAAMTGIITLKNVGGCKVEKLSLDGNKSTYAETSNNGLYLYNANNNTIMGNTCKNCSSGIKLYSTSNDNTIINNLCNSNTYGIEALSNNSGNIIANNICNDNINSGISLSSSSNNSLTDNRADNNGSSGIFLSNSNSNTVNSNICKDNTIGINVANSSNRNSLIGNTCIRGSGIPGDYSGTQHTIQVPGTNNENNLITNNNCMGKIPTVDGGTGNTLVNNKYDDSDDIKKLEAQINDLATQMNTKPTEFAIPYINSIVAETDYKNTYFIDHLKIVHIIAYYKKSGTSDDITNTAQLFTLPVGYRPNSKVIAFAKCIMGTSPVSCDVSIGIDGIVRVYTPTGASYKFGEFDISFLGGN